MDISTVRGALAEWLTGYLDLSSVPVNGYGYPPDSPQLNALIVLPRVDPETGGYVDYHRSFGSTTTDATGALCQVGLTVELRTGGGQIDAPKAMDLLLSCGNPESIVDALLSDPTLGGAIQTLALGACTAPAWFGDVDGTRTWLSASLPLTIWTRR